MRRNFSLHAKIYQFEIHFHILVYFTAREHWTKHITTGAYYQLNTQSALTWSQAETSCKQQGASLLSITDPHQQAYVTGKLTLVLIYLS